MLATIITKTFRRASNDVETGMNSRFVFERMSMAPSLARPPFFVSRYINIQCKIGACTERVLQYACTSSTSKKMVSRAYPADWWRYGLYYFDLYVVLRFGYWRVCLLTIFALWHWAIPHLLVGMRNTSLADQGDRVPPGRSFGYDAKDEEERCLPPKLRPLSFILLDSSLSTNS